MRGEGGGGGGRRRTRGREGKQETRDMAQKGQLLNNFDEAGTIFSRKLLFVS